MGLIERFRSMYVGRTSPINVVLERRKPQISPEERIAKQAHTIARNVRDHGEQKFGLMWAQGYVMLPDGRIVFLQQSQQSHGAVQVSEALEINIPYTPNYQYSTHIRYDLVHDEINTYEMREEDGKPIVAYWRLDHETQVPADIVGPVEKILQSVEIASNKIMWTKP